MFLVSEYSNLVNFRNMVSDDDDWLTWVKTRDAIASKNDLKWHENVKTENDPWCVLTPISQLLLGQNWKSRTVLKSSEQADFKTDLPFWIWWRFEGVIAKKQTVYFFCGHGVLLREDFKKKQC